MSQRSQEMSPAEVVAATTEGVDAAPHLSTRTVAWLADHPHAHQVVRSVCDKVTELERSGQYPGTIDALRRVLTRHQPAGKGSSQRLSGSGTAPATATPATGGR